MNINASARYQMYEYKKTIRWYYVSLLGVIIFLGLLSSFISDTGGFTLGGLEFTTSILLFIMGLYSFKESFLMMLQNGVSRKTMFISRLITILTASFSLAVIDRLILNFGDLIHKVYDKILITSFYDSLFAGRIAKLNIIVGNLEAIFITIFIYMSVTLFGYFIAIAYYKMNKTVKVIVSITVPTALFVVLPIIDFMIFKGKLSLFIGKIFRFVLGMDSGTPYNLLITMILFIAVCTGVCWLMVRKSVEK